MGIVISQHKNLVVVWNMFYFYPGKMIHFDEHMFQLGWLNHQLDKDPQLESFFSTVGVNEWLRLCRSAPMIQKLLGSTGEARRL